MDRFRDGSGVFGVAGHALASRLATSGLRALQHRAAGAAALATGDTGAIRVHRGIGTVDDVLGPVQVQALAGRFAIGQVSRLTDAAASLSDALEPADRLVTGRLRDARVAIVVGGRFTNAARLRQEVADRGAVLQGSSDAELLLHLMAHSPQRTVINRLVDALWRVDGSYVALALLEDRLVAVRDPRGFRPLLLGRIDDATAIASDEAAIRAAEGEPRREVRPGEMIIVDARGAQSVQPFRVQPPSRCVQELLTIARPDARAFAEDVWEVRRELGARAGEPAGGSGPAPELVVPITPLAEPMATGLARRASLPVVHALVAEDDRFTAYPSPLADRSVLLATPTLADGSEVRAAGIALRAAGAREVHVRVGSPPVRSGCRFGQVGPTTDELALAGRGVGALADWLGVDSIGFISGLPERLAGEGWCRACLGETPPLQREEAEDQLTLF